MNRCLKLEIALNGLVFWMLGCGSENRSVRSDVPASAVDQDAGLSDASLPTAADASSASCGNGMREIEEDCDDGNTMSGDGCSASCQVEQLDAATACPGSEVSLTLQPDGLYLGRIEAQTTDLTHYSFGSCGGSGPEYVARFTMPEPGGLELALDAEHDAVLYARSSCVDEASELGCAQEWPWGGTERLFVELERGEDIFVFADGVGREAGAIALTAQLTPRSCVNRELGPLETCEDGNLVDGDGCSSLCRVEGNPNACPGAELLVGAASVEYPLLVRGDTFGQGNTHKPLECSAPSWVGESIYALTAEYDGHLTVELTASETHHVLYLRSSCAVQSSQLTCAEKVQVANVLAPLRVPVRAAETVFLFVDSARPIVAGPFDLAITLLPARCGNGRLDPDEACDDGNDTLGDGCEACAFASSASDDTCPGVGLTLKQETSSVWTAHWTGTTRQKVGNFQSQGPVLCAERSARDTVYRVSPPSDGFLSAQVTSNFDASLSLRTLCSIESAVAQPNLSLEEADAIRAAELLCDNRVAGSGMESFERVPVTQGSDVFVLIDSKSAGASGTFALSIQFEARGDAE